MIDYYLLTKPGIIFGNLLTLAAGFVLGSKGHINIALFLATLLGLTLIMASGCILNNYIDRHIDEKMERTKNRAIVQGTITGRNAITCAIFLGITGAVTLLTFTNILTTAVACFGFFVYVVLYSMWKCRTVYGTAIGSIAGAVPPVVGYCAASNQFDLAAAIFFLLMILWQMPHFFAIALLHIEDYTKAGIPVLPITKGIFRTKIHMSIYILCFITMTMMLTLFNYTGNTFLYVAAAIGLVWLGLSLQGFYCDNNRLWARRMFIFSLVMIGAICIVLPLDLVIL